MNTSQDSWTVVFRDGPNVVYGTREEIEEFVALSEKVGDRVLYVKEGSSDADMMPIPTNTI